MIPRIRKIKATSSWLKDFYTLLIRGLPTEFKECGVHMRGLYYDKIICKWYMKPNTVPGRNTYQVSVDKASLDEGWTLKKAVSDMIADIDKIAKKNGYACVRTPSDIEPMTYLMGLKGLDLILIAQT